MRRSTGLCVAMGIVGLGVASVAAAVPITGSFSGTAFGWRILGPGESQTPFTDEPITGTFAFDTQFSDPDIYPGDGSVGYFGWPMRVTFDVFGYERIFDSASDEYVHALNLFDDPSGQAAELWFFAAYSNASLRFAAPNGGLFDDFDPATFDPSAIDVAASTADFSAHTRSEGIGMRFDSITFDGYEPQPVPEPTTLALLGAGLLGLGLARRRRDLARD